MFKYDCIAHLDVGETRRIVRLIDDLANADMEMLLPSVVDDIAGLDRAASPLRDALAEYDKENGA